MRTPLQLDYATGEPVCFRCWASLEGRASWARYCSPECQNRAKAKRQRERRKA